MLVSPMSDQLMTPLAVTLMLSPALIENLSTRQFQLPLSSIAALALSRVVKLVQTTFCTFMPSTVPCSGMAPAGFCSPLNTPLTTTLMLSPTLADNPALVQSHIVSLTSAESDCRVVRSTHATFRRSRPVTCPVRERRSRLP